ncbi:hypothetical protein MN608_10858 [Microdochium nivale]|nr:hypothetical protein MN608_10858 [Microdochium nivale]
MRLPTQSLAVWLLALAAGIAAIPPRHSHVSHHPRPKCGGPPVVTPSATTTATTSYSAIATTSSASSTVSSSSSHSSSSSSGDGVPAGTICTALTTVTDTDTVVISTTITPALVTTSTTEFETTTITIITSETLTFSTTSTDFTTQTTTTISTSTATHVSTSTTTVTSAIVTAPAPEGLVPINSQYPPASPTTAMRRLPAQQDTASLTHVPQLFVLPLPETDTFYTVITYTEPPPCTSTLTSTITTSTAVTETIETTLPAETVIATTTSTITTDTTSLDTPASTTLSFSTTSIITELLTEVSLTTTTTTTTTTKTVPNPTPTYYAGCGPDYILSDGPGRSINKLDWGDPRYSTLAEPRSAYECCVACLLRPATCAGAAWYSRRCRATNVFGGTCAPDVPAGIFGFWSGAKTGYAVSNGMCGRWRLG